MTTGFQAASPEFQAALTEFQLPDYKTVCWKSNLHRGIPTCRLVDNVTSPPLNVIVFWAEAFQLRCASRAPTQAPVAKPICPGITVYQTLYATMLKSGGK